jgi:uncharacterized low-complexity protein
VAGVEHFRWNGYICYTILCLKIYSDSPLRNYYFVKPPGDLKMSDKYKLNPLAVALGTTFAISLASSPIVNAADNPFNMTDLGSGYMVAEEGSCGDKKGEGSCGDKKGEGKAEGEGKCGEGKCGDKKKAHEGKCGEGKCGDKKKAEGSCGDKKAEGSCGDKKAEGSCGDKKAEGSGGDKK